MPLYETLNGYILLLASLIMIMTIQVSVLLGNWQQVLNYYNKAEASIDSTDVSKMI